MHRRVSLHSRVAKRGQYRPAPGHLVSCLAATGRDGPASDAGGSRLRAADHSSRCLGEIPSNAARRHPRRTALIAEGSRLSFADLEARIGAAASAFGAAGLGRGDRAAILLPNHPVYLDAFFGISRAGGIVVPVSTFLAPVEVATVLQDSRAGILITTRRRLASLGAHLPQLAVLKRILLVEAEEGASIQIPSRITAESWEEFLRRGAAQAAGFAASPDPSALAVLTYTSGTTGRMKGVMLSHENLLANARACLLAVKVRPGDRLLLFLPMFHSFTQLVCVILPFLAGLPVVLLPGVDRGAIRAAITRHRPTLFVAVPAIYAAMAERPPGFFARLLNPIRLYICGGAPLSKETLARFEAGWRRPLCEGYGLSEASPVVSLNPPDGERRAGSVGMPLPGVEVRIGSEDGSPLPAGEVGDILVRGASVMMGYHERTEDTAAALRDGWLVTGDLGRFDDDGYLYIAGRRKEMLIYRGLNVYPREVEEVLAVHPAVAESAVVGVEDAQRGEAPHAAVVLRAGATATEKEIRAHCAAHLARYKVPRSVSIVASLPRNPTGKVMKDQVLALLQSSRRGGQEEPEGE